MQLSTSGGSGRSKLFVAIAAVFLLFVGLLVVGFSADIDNWVGYFSGRDLRTLRQLDVGGESLGDRVARTLAVEKWSAFHAGDQVNLTVIDCTARTSQGQPVVLSWEVAHRYSPRGGVPRTPLLITALTREAATLTPQFVPSGFRLSDYPADRLRFRFSSALYGYASRDAIRRERQ